MRRTLFFFFLMLSMMWSTGCGDDDDGSEVSDNSASAECQGACERVYKRLDDGGCQQSFYHDGQILEGEAKCAEVCQDDDSLMYGTESCVADDSQVECQSEPSEMVDICLSEMGEEEHCVRACRRVYGSINEGGCQQSFFYDGEAVEGEAECIAVCREDESLMEGTESCVADDSQVECQSEPGQMVEECLPKIEGQATCEAACDRVYSDSDEGGCQQSFNHQNTWVNDATECVDLCINDESFMVGTENCIADDSRVECQSQPEEMVRICLSEDDVVVEACEHLELWDSEAYQMEQQVVDIVNEVRSEGVTCTGTGEQMPVVDTLEMNPFLRCAARLHSMNMVETGEFAHEIDGEEPADRAVEAGYAWQDGAENIAQGQPNAQAVVDAWVSSDTGHCEDLMNGEFQDIGMGVVIENGTPWWTQKFGTEQ